MNKWDKLGGQVTIHHRSHIPWGRMPPRPPAGGPGPGARRLWHRRSAASPSGPGPDSSGFGLAPESLEVSVTDGGSAAPHCLPTEPSSSLLFGCQRRQWPCRGPPSASIKRGRADGCCHCWRNSHPRAVPFLPLCGPRAETRFLKSNELSTRSEEADLSSRPLSEGPSRLGVPSAASGGNVVLEGFVT